MARKVPAPGHQQRGGDQQGQGGGENRMAHENGEVHGTNRAGSGESRGAGLPVVDDVGNQKQRGYTDRCEHHIAVSGLAPPPDQQEAYDEKDRCRGVEQCIDGGQGGHRHVRSLSRSRRRTSAARRRNCVGSVLS